MKEFAACFILMCSLIGLCLADTPPYGTNEIRAHIDLAQPVVSIGDKTDLTVTVQGLPEPLLRELSQDADKIALVRAGSDVFRGHTLADRNTMEYEGRWQIKITINQIASSLLYDIMIENVKFVDQGLFSIELRSEKGYVTKLALQPWFDVVHNPSTPSTTENTTPVDSGMIPQGGSPKWHIITLCLIVIAMLFV